MTFPEQLITIAAVVLGTITTRFLPFLLFPDTRHTPPLVSYLAEVLPPAVIGMLVVYALRDTQVLNAPYALPEIIAVTLTVLLEETLHKLLLSVAVGTLIYMYLVQAVFC